MTGKKKNAGALVVVVARCQRTTKVRELTSAWDDENWEHLCSDIKRQMLGRSFLPDQPLFVLPHFEDSLHLTVSMKRNQPVV